jgi:mannosyl-3-phosphoglycerate phosphatase
MTDVDGTLLDHDTYSFAEAAGALGLLGREGVPVILSSSKTRAELELLQRQLRISHPFVCENGGALFVPDGYFPFPVPATRRLRGYHAIEFGRPYKDVVGALHAAAAALEIEITGFSDMSADEVARQCNLSLFQARLAKRREYDEPFLIHDLRPAARGDLFDGLHERGLRCTRGGRFFHVTGPTDKAQGARLLRAFYERATGRPVVIVGLGNSPNDLCLLREADIPVVVRNRETEVDEFLLSRVPFSRLTDGLGPSGWAEAVEEAVRAVL